MCTAVDGGSIHRAARSTSAASDQISSTPIASLLAKDRRKLLRIGVLGSASGFSVTFQNNSLGWLPPCLGYPLVSSRLEWISRRRLPKVERQQPLKTNEPEDSGGQDARVATKEPTNGSQAEQSLGLLGEAIQQRRLRMRNPEL